MVQLIAFRQFRAVKHQKMTGDGILIAISVKKRPRFPTKGTKPVESTRETTHNGAAWRFFAMNRPENPSP